MPALNNDINDEINIKLLRPTAGEVRKFATGEVVFLAPLPVPTGDIPMDLDGSFLDVNEAYLDIGSSNFNKAFQTQAMIGLTMAFIITCVVIGPLIIGLTAFGDPYGRSFSDNFLEFFFPGLEFSMWGGLGFSAIGIYVILSSTFNKTRSRPIRFHRQRREVCFFPDGSDEQVIQPWEEMVSWLSVSTGVTGVGVMRSYTFGMAFDDPKRNKAHFVNQIVMTPTHAFSKWEAIRVYMEKGPMFCPDKAPYEGRHTFDQQRETISQEYREGDRSAFGVGWWYFSHLITLWRFPYWVAEWDHRYSMKSLPNSIAEWSKSLPPEQWAKPSQALKEQSAKIETAFAQGQDFMTYFKANLNESNTEESVNN
jgi:hypothetical protein